MKIIWTGELDRRKKFETLIAEGHQKMRQHYGPTHKKNWQQELEDLFRIENDLRRKKVLVLGCGSNGGTEEHREYHSSGDKEMYQPWLCRVLHQLAIEVIGVDIGDLDGELFQHYQHDLLSKNALAMVPDHSIDLAYSRLLFSSPELGKLINRCNLRDTEVDRRIDALMVESHYDSPSAWASTKSAHFLWKRLKPCIERVVKADGIFFYNESSALPMDYFLPK